jgi:hypothetical protein
VIKRQARLERFSTKTKVYAALGMPRRAELGGVSKELALTAAQAVETLQDVCVGWGCQPEVGQWHTCASSASISRRYGVALVRADWGWTSSRGGQ